MTCIVISIFTRLLIDLIIKMSEQAQTIDLRFLAESQPSLCIPRVFNNITETKIRQVFDELGLGKISKIDIKERKNEKGEPVKKLYIHFEKWFWNESAQSARRKLISGKEIKIVYDNPWFWKVSASKWAPSNNNYEIGSHSERPNTRERTVRIMSDYEERRGGRHYERHDERQERHYENRNNSRVNNRYEEQPRNNHDYKQRDRHSEDRRHLVPTLNIAPTSNVAPSLPSISKNSCPIVPKLQLKEKIVPLLEPIRKRSKYVLPLEIKVEEELEDGEIKELDVVEIVEVVEVVEVVDVVDDVVVEEMSEERKELLNELYGDIKFN